VHSDHFDQPGWYEIGVQGHLDERWSTWFDGMELVADPSGSTCIQGPVVDQAALHGLLSRLRDLGLPLLFVHRVDARTPPSATEE
jgi:hypothetical protein